MEIDPLGELEEALMDRSTASKQRMQRILLNKSTSSFSIQKVDFGCNQFLKKENSSSNAHLKQDES